MKIKLDNLDHDDGMVTVYCEDQAAAKEDQTIMGSHWETPRDVTAAYAIISDEPELLAKLAADGYEVDDDDYFPGD